MQRLLISAVALAFLVTLPRPVAAQDANVVGAWKVKDFTAVEVESKKVVRGFGEKPYGYYVFSDGVFIGLVINSDRKKPAAPNPTDAERVELSKTMGFTTGRYTLAGTKVTIAVDGSATEFPTGTTQVREAKISGDTMELVSPEVRSTATGNALIFTVTLERVKK